MIMVFSLFNRSKNLKLKTRDKSTRDNHVCPLLLASVANNVVDPVEAVLESEALRDRLGSTGGCSSSCGGSESC